MLAWHDVYQPAGARRHLLQEDEVTLWMSIILILTWRFTLKLHLQVIMVPEYIYSTHVHEILQPERIAKGVRILAPDIALVFHLRLLFSCL